MSGKIILPGSEIITTTRPFQDVTHAGPYSIGACLPWRGVNLVVARIMSNGERFELVMVPIGLTKGAIKSMTGKKGRRDGRPLGH